MCVLYCINNQVEVIDVKLMRRFCSASLGVFPPLTAALGGVVAQEALISLTGKFSPLHQWVSQCVVLIGRARASTSDGDSRYIIYVHGYYIMCTCSC